MAAKMKHPRPSGRPPPRPVPPPKAPRPLGSRRGQQAFREQLAREYGVEQPPKAFQQRFEQTLLQLPDQVPVRPRPVYYLLRRTAAAAAALVVTFAALLGVNTTYPQLTEALPGLGPVFRAVNGSEAEPSPSPEPLREFQPVTLGSTGDFPCLMQVEDAWCDGKTLQLKLSIEKSPKLFVSMGYSEEEAEFLWEEGYGLQATAFSAGIETDGFGSQVFPDYSMELSAGGESWTGTGELSSFTDNGQGRLQATWQVELDENLRQVQTEELRVTFAMKTLSLVRQQYEMEPYPEYTWQAGFETKLAVPVDQSKNRVFTSQMTDNGAALLQVDYSPSRVDVELETPEMGYLGDLLLEFPGYGEKDPLGSFARLEGQFRAADGSGIAGFSYELVSREELEGSNGARRLRFSFFNAYMQEDCRGPLVLTVTETPLWPSRVVAEFTIDLDTGSIAPSESYLNQGLERADTSRESYPLDADCFTNGFLAVNVLHSQEDYMGAAVTLAAEAWLEPGRVLVLNGYSQGALMQSFMAVTGEDPVEDEQGSYQQWETVTPSWGEVHTMLGFQLYPPGNMNGTEGGFWSGYDRLELVDGDTGKVLIEDLMQAHDQAVAALTGQTSEEAVPLAGEEAAPLP